MPVLPVIVVALAGLGAAFVLAWLLARWLDNYGLVDVVWAWAFAGVAVCYGLALPGWYLRKFTIGAMVVLWSVRLGTHLFLRVARMHPVEDSRYAALRRDWADNFGPKMLGFFLLQAASVALLALPFLLAMRNPAPGLGLLEQIGVAVWFAGLSGEAAADGQLAAFKRDPANRHAVCNVGLWRYSRHPNYFFEWLVWVGFFLFALGSPWGWTAVVAPAGILWLLLRVTGIPLAEEQSLRSKGDAYRRYQATTSAFVPWLPRAERAQG